MLIKQKLTIEKDSVTEMKKLIELTNKYNREYGGSLCKDENDTVYLENICAGKETCFHPKSHKCSENRNEIGLFHTHPGIDSITPSVVELPQKKDEIQCIGQKTENGNRILCIKLKKDQIHNDSSRQFEAWNIDDITNTKRFKYFGIGFEKYEKEMNKHIKKYYDETYINESE